MTKTPATRTRHDRRADRAAKVEEAPAAAPAATEAASDDDAGGVYRATLHAEIRPDPNQPRKHFDDEKLAELALSVANDGLIEPIVLRPDPADASGFLIVAGERRWRAVGQAIFAGAWMVDRPLPAMVRQGDEQTIRRLALIENLQRDDLNPIEEARAIAALQELTGASAAQLGRDLGFTERWAQQRLSLLKLPEGLQARVDRNDIKVEDARQAAAIWDQLPAIKRTEIERGAITVAEARRWLDEQPKPLSEAAMLAIMELYERLEAAPYKAGYSGKATKILAKIEKDDRGPNGILTRHRVEDPKGAFDELRKRNLIEAPGRVLEELVETGETYVSTGYNGDYYLKQAFKSALDPKFRKANIPTLRVLVYGLQVDHQAGKTGSYATPWLNVPEFRPTAEVEGAIAVARANRLAREQENREYQQRQATLRAEEERKRKEASAAVEPELRQAFAVNAGAFTGSLVAKSAELGFALPLFLCEDSSIVDANGAEFLESVYHWQRDARMPALRLMVAAINVAAGLETPAQRPVPMDPDAIPRAEFLAMVAEHLRESGDVAADDAEAKAEEALDNVLAEDGWVYGEADAYDWNANGALSLAEQIRRDHADATTEESDETAQEEAEDDDAEDDDGEITDPKLLALAGVKTA
jgi:ParB/RepB/Spo0J family partition protein